MSEMDSHKDGKTGKKGKVIKLVDKQPAEKPKVIDWYFMVLKKMPKTITNLVDGEGINHGFAELDSSGLVIAQHPDQFKRKVLGICEYLPVECLQLLLNDSRMREFTTFFEMQGPKLDVADIMQVTFADDERLSWCKLPFKLLGDSIGLDAPTWSEIVSRTTNRDAFIEFIGSLFCDGSDRSQYLWLYGDGGNGKSSMMTVLMEILGKSAVYDVASTNWVGGKWQGKRLVVFDDTNNFQFVTTEIFKQATGGCEITAKEKYIKNWSFKPVCKFIFTSNQRPNIGSGRSDMRRAIYCEIGKVAGELLGEEYIDMLRKEAQAFISICVHTYLSANQKLGRIAVDTQGLEDMVADNEADFAAVVEEHLNIGEGQLMTNPEFSQLLGILGLRGFASQSAEVRRFKDYMRRSHGIVFSKVVNIDGASHRRHVGMSLRTGLR